MEFNATFIVSVISFLMFTFLMNTILYRPIENIVEEREKLIRENYELASSNKLKSKSLLDDRIKALAKSRLEAKNIVNENIKLANLDSDRQIKEAKLSGSKFVENEKNILNQQEKELESLLEENVLELAQAISDKILDEHIAIGGNYNG